MASTPAINRFQKLVDDISTFYLNARDAQVKFAWETGRRIVEEEQNGAMRAQYGSRLIPELSQALLKQYGPGFSERTLRNMRHFFAMNPIRQPAAKLDWSAFVELMPVQDEKTRKRLQERIVKENLNRRQLRREVRAIRRAQGLNGTRIQDNTGAETQAQKESNLAPLKYPADLKLNTFSLSPLKVRLKDNQVLIDCGFFVSWPVPKEELKTLCISDAMSYTYAATVDRVVDGDTLLALIEVGFGIIVRDRLRLRGINCPELSTPEGEYAKKYVEKLLPAGSAIVLKSHKCKTDIYGRFVADVFFQEGVDDPDAVIKDGVYLNQRLLDEGLAVRME